MNKKNTYIDIQIIKEIIVKGFLLVIVMVGIFFLFTLN